MNQVEIQGIIDALNNYVPDGGQQQVSASFTNDADNQLAPLEFGPKARAREHTLVGSEAVSEGAGTVSNHDKNNDSSGQTRPNQEAKVN
jgi:hypothetical protein